MANFDCTMFGHILYDDKLTFQELLDTETRVMAVMQAALEECGAQHITFTGQADSLMMECVFPQVDRDNNHILCDAVIRHLGPGVLARFMFADRQMDSVAFYFLGRGKWQEQVLSVPNPKQALSGWVVRQERKLAMGRGVQTERVSRSAPLSSEQQPAPEAHTDAKESTGKVKLDISDMEFPFGPPAKTNGSRS